jgi:hypothetical protein
MRYPLIVRTYLPYRSAMAAGDWIKSQEKETNFDRTKSTMKNIRFEDELLEKIEKAAGKGNFSKWVKEACRLRLLSE